MKNQSKLCPEIPEIGTPEYITMMSDFEELQNRMVVFRCPIVNIKPIYAWCEKHGIDIKLCNHWSANDNGGFASFEMLRETYTEERKVLLLLRWA